MSSCLIVVVVRIAIEDEVPPTGFGIADKQIRAVVVVKVHQLNLSAVSPQRFLMKTPLSWTRE